MGQVREGVEVKEVMIAPHPTRPPAYGVVAEVTATDALVRCPNGHEERVPLDRFGSSRPQAWWRIVRARPGEQR